MSQQTFKLLCDRFPDNCNMIHRLAQENSSFNEIVQDYTDVIEVLKRWRASENPNDENRVKEYRRLRNELESEIEQFLIAAVKSSSL